MFFLLLNLKEQQKSGQSYNGLRKSSFRSKGGQKFCRNQSKSIKFVMSCAGHVDGVKK